MKLIPMVSDVVALLGVLLCLVAGLARLGGSYYLSGFEVMTIFDAGVATMVFACLLKLYLIEKK
ncbi:MAG: hypothetical protein R3E57_05175 [Porticoccaceae bacterium]